MDKNKSAYKLEGMAPIYLVNLDGQTERLKYMEDQFKYWKLDGFERISACDGRDDDLSDISNSDQVHLFFGDSYLEGAGEEFLNKDPKFGILNKSQKIINNLRK